MELGPVTTGRPSLREAVSAPFIRIPEAPDGEALSITAAERDRWAAKGWVDLRPANFARWQQRLQAIRSGRPGKWQPGSAGVTPETTVTESIETGSLAAWVLAEELGGYRIK